MCEPDPTAVFDDAATTEPVHIPESIGRYQIEKILGRGGFGLVFLAFDPQLNRRVAIKVPHARLVSRTDDAAAYLAEAQTVAQLDHPHVVPVYDVGHNDDFPCYVVSKYIEGSNLEDVRRQRRFSHLETARLILIISEVLRYAHLRGVVHRDIKPGNILIDADGRPFVVDFGLALREQQFGKGPQYIGTPSYMSPEQARGEGHRVDGRSDIFSLGAVFYVLLTGRKPFYAEQESALLEQISTLDPRPPRQIDDRIPKELERICLKAMARRATERYTTAQDLGDDLRRFLTDQPSALSRDAITPATMSPLAAGDSTHSHRGSPTSETASALLRIVPKGLRAFDEHDADFFLELVPGPRDREGLPDQLRFWKTRIEESDADKTFTAGLIYGPSGCGKSSLVRAGLLPRLAPQVVTVFVEATAEDTERRLAGVLRKSIATMPRTLSLVEMIAAVRRGKILEPGRKLLIVLDQFEQWLHAKKEETDTELVQALRQCDGELVQCLVLVRDDFWLAATRFMAELEVDLLQGHNTALVDLFDQRHARKVLSAFGLAFGALNAEARQLTNPQEQFLDQAIRGLAQDGRVICVRLALFAEMVKGKPWTPATLKQVGGIEGVGLTFLEETFSSAAANPKHRLHQNAARAVLTALLPELGTDIKGSHRSYTELLQASGYESMPKEFDDLIRILDTETRLITPAEPEGDGTSTSSLRQPERGQKYYQLSHDYLVHSLRDWLTRKQKETWRGRAELCLAERTILWDAKHENRRLPSSWEWLLIRTLTPARHWTPTQRHLMATATSFHGVRWGFGLTLVLAVIVTLVAARRQFLADRKRHSDEAQAALLVQSLLSAPAAAVPYMIKNIEPLRQFAVPLLRQQFDDSSNESADRLRAAVALAEFESVEVQFLVASIDAAPAVECMNIATALNHAADVALESLHQTATQAGNQMHWRQQARLAVIAIQLGNATLVREMLEAAPDPAPRTVLIDSMADWHGGLEAWWRSTAAEQSGAVRSGICLGLGRISRKDLPTNQFKELSRTILNWYQDQADSGTHSAAGWALAQWEIALPTLAAEREILDRDWYINSVGMTMLRIHSGKFVRPTSAPRRDPVDSASEPASTVFVAKPFWLSDREMSIRQFKQFAADPECLSQDKPASWKGPDVTRSPSVEHPVQNVSWIDAVLYCNWLSHKEALRPCYQLRENQWELVTDANGYRLPSEAEWEYACRAGTTTAYATGDDDSFLGQYAVYQANHAEVCGLKLPNAWGLFDMHGNIYEWCHDWWHEGFGDGKLDPSKPPERVLRGGAYDFATRYARSSDRGGNRPAYRSPTIGFRAARNIP